ncbi:MAG: hypothetical protein GY790_08400 [Bacteroidetes bacterium]|nr:hypothetical protein [Bacteroidota bacterium]
MLPCFLPATIVRPGGDHDIGGDHGAVCLVSYGDLVKRQDQNMADPSSY